ncbi:MAG TPA: CBS domain-containing protein [Candidatus Dormibacteraeota bacterium]|nr:CBS domain-containing protein [Candidatus Dormibacteraeota bacterium]
MSAPRPAAVVGDVMTSPVSTIGPHTVLKEAAARLQSGRCSALPVVDEGGRVVGVLSEADLLVKAERPSPVARAAAGSYADRLERRRWSGTVVSHLMSQPAVTVGPDTPLADAARLMHRHGLKRLPVVDAGGRPVGIVSRGDLLQVFLRGDEEIRRDVEELVGSGVAVEDGVVTLLGVADDAERRRVTTAVEEVDGVVAVRHLPGDTVPMNHTRSSGMNVEASDIEVLSERECLELLRSHRVGRIALVDHGQPLIFPVNYAADDRAVVFRTAPGIKLTEAPMSRVAFEIDEVDQAAGTAWSVMARGVAYDVTSALDHLSEGLRELVVEPMAPGERRNWVAIVWRELSGRRFRLEPLPGRGAR